MKAIAIGSKYALKTKNKRERYGRFYDEDNIYYYKILIGGVNFGITCVTNIEERMDDKFYGVYGNTRPSDGITNQYNRRG